MGIQGIYKEIGPGRRVALSKLAVDKFEEAGRPFRIAIDVSIWLFQIQASKGGTNPALRTFYYRLLRLIALSIHPVFVFDGPNKPPFKRNKRTGGPGVSVASIPEFLAKQLLKQFGFPIHLAPGEAEAECALLQREGIVDAVLSEDVDTLMFGSGVTIRNWSPEKSSGKTPTHVNVYDAVETKNGPSGLDREGMILVALMSGGDYVPEGIPGCGPKTACEAARAGFGSDLCRIARHDTKALKEWRERLRYELNTNESKLFTRKRPSMTIPDDFPRTDILGYYTHPAISNQTGLERLRSSIRWDQDIDFPGLRSFTCDAFDWAKLEGAKHFVHSLAPSLLVRHLRMRGEQTDRFPSNDMQTVQEDETLLVKGIHGKRQHAVTDSSTELRVSFRPIELVKIDLSTEEPDDGVEILTSEAGLEEELPLEIDDDVEGPKKRGPTKFDPSKPARAWVMETYVKVGVPLKVQDWEAEQQKPLKAKRTASAKDTSAAATKTRGARRAKVTDKTPQISIQSFAKVTKPGCKSSRAPLKAGAQLTASQPVNRTEDAVISLLSSSPVRVLDTIVSRGELEMSLSPFAELSSSISKRRRGPVQRARTLPSDPSTAFGRPESPPLDIIETLDLVDPILTPAPSRISTKKARTRAMKKVTTSVTYSPEKTRQTTLDLWRSAEDSPSKPRKPTAVLDSVPIPRPHSDVAAKDVETLDLTLSSPLHRASPQQDVASTRSRRNVAPTSKRLPLVSLSSSASNISAPASSIASTNSKIRAKIAPTSRRTCPRLQRTTSVSLDTDSLDLTQLSSSPPSTVAAPVTRPDSPPPRQRMKSASTDIKSLDLTDVSSPRTTRTDINLRRSPRGHKSTSPEPPQRKLSPPAAWKTKAKKKREVVLRKSLAGAWAFVDAESPAKAGGDVEHALKGKERRRWRESEIEILDLC